MSDWKAKRFWKSAGVVAAGDGFAVELDGRPVKTPAKAALVVPTAAMAQAVALEWDAQDGQINPATMPVTKSANAAIDKVSVQFTEVADLLAAYGDSDLTCYRAAQPKELVARQERAWDPLLDWAESRFGARLVPVQGVMHHPQATESLANLTGPLREMSPFELTAMHDLISLTGSFVIGMAASEGHLPAAELWNRSRIDEDWQIEQWGEDELASAEVLLKQQAFQDAARFLTLTRG